MMKLYWSPRSRSFSALWLMEETGEPYERVLTDISKGAQKTPEYQGRSIGRRLLAFTRTLLPDEIWLRCVRENEKAWRWYEREGFAYEREALEPAMGRMMKYYRWKRGAAS